ncbi:hypothetical protein ITJ50_00845 [Curtobacterium sp. VKM Ac-2889]|uniref:hypothetical protein n=1 Tax=unclassified Curtobacterium TaxID=257496 RepID=UPI00188A70F6|nr:MULTISPECIES: hypothetical protein [unclassified Curtobacterium]MBF4597191.1 hypothetical protein [Curtobacterium sp. VKM Ac-1796]MBF4609765.1 hypothetical protein [Curtobacterium sp. VKM Ac-2889]
MITTLTAETIGGESFDVRVSSPDDGPQIIAVKQTVVNGGVESSLGFDLMLDPSGVQVHAPSGSVGFQMRVEFQSLGKRRMSSDGVTFYEGDVIPLWLQLRTEIPVHVPFEDVSIELWLSK